jgi:hypothetical protein
VVTAVTAVTAVTVNCFIELNPYIFLYEAAIVIGKNVSEKNELILSQPEPQGQETFKSCLRGF